MPPPRRPAPKFLELPDVSQYGFTDEIVNVSRLPFIYAPPLIAPTMLLQKMIRNAQLNPQTGQFDADVATKYARFRV